ncbi:MAG: DUF1232 domain-containing protein [Bacteroidaceae bacterium]|nr:DUF1232 domain-containing protein [Bacteroidaceae bacterium]
MSEKFDAKDVQLQKYEKHYSEPKLWDKIKNFAKNAGKEVIYNVLLLYYALQSDQVSAKEKAVIIGALGYFILPIDLIPDVIPVVGYSDDLAVLIAVIKLLTCVDDDVKRQAKEKLAEWFD